ncbi:MAG: hypothetical protein WKF97_13420 [Chitinophagaceae bacterium]
MFKGKEAHPTPFLSFQVKRQLVQRSFDNDPTSILGDFNESAKDTFMQAAYGACANDRKRSKRFTFPVRTRERGKKNLIKRKEIYFL